MSRFTWFHSVQGGRRRHNSQRRSPTLGRWARFERLEDRLALSATAVVEDGVLRIDGDDADNLIDVAILGDQATVILDGGAPQLFSGLGSAFNAVKIDARGGDDTVSFRANDVTVGPGSEVKFDVVGGKGNDTMSASVQGITVNEGGEFTARLKGGDGDDTLSLAADTVLIDGEASLKVDGGKGDDSITASAAHITVNGELKAELKGGAGNDTFSVVADDVLIDGKASVKVKGGKGDDSLSLTATNITINGEFKAKVDVETLTTNLQDSPPTLGPDAKVRVDLGKAAQAAPMMPADELARNDAARGVILEFDNMAGVSGPFLGDANPIRGVPGGGRPWVLEEGRGKLEADGRLKVEVQGLIIPASEGPEFGINPVPFFRAIVSFLTVDEAGNVVTHNIITDPASTRMLGDPQNGDAVIEETLVLPSPAIAPIVFVTSPTGSWFAVTDGASAA